MRLEGRPATCLLVLAWPLLRVRTQSRCLLSGSLFRSDVFSGTAPTTSSIGAAYGLSVQLQAARGKVRHAAGAALCCIRTDWMPDVPKASLQRLARGPGSGCASTASFQRRRLGSRRARTEPQSGAFGRQPRGWDPSLPSALLRAHRDWHGHSWPCCWRTDPSAPSRGGAGPPSCWGLHRGCTRKEKKHLHPGKSEGWDLMVVYG